MAYLKGEKADFWENCISFCEILPCAFAGLEI